MKIYKIAFLLFFLSFSIYSQNRTSIVGDWYILEFDDIENGQLYVDGTDFRGARMFFSKNGRFSGNLICNTIGGVYQVEENQLIIPEFSSTKMACKGAPLAIETAFKAYYRELTIEAQGGNFYITAPGKFKILLSRFR